MWIVLGMIDAISKILAMAIILAVATYVISNQAIRRNWPPLKTMMLLTVCFFPALYFFLWVTWSAP